MTFTYSMSVGEMSWGLTGEWSRDGENSKGEERDWGKLEEGEDKQKWYPSTAGYT